MLGMLFLICAVVGGALVAAQLLLSVMAIGAGRGLRVHHRMGGSVGTHGAGLQHAGGQNGGVRGGMFRGLHHRGGRSAVRASPPRGVRTSGGAKQSIKTAIKTAAAPGAANSAVGWHYWGHWAMTWVTGMLNFQGVVCGLTVFGLVGLAANAAKRPGSVAVEFGVIAALVMMALINGMFSMMTGLEKDGTVDLQQAIGKMATVYLSIPEKNHGQGKVTLSLQQRFMEFPAVTFQDDLLATGQKVMIVAVLDPAIMLVVSADRYADYQASLSTE
jgi:hypothetical protein